MSFYPGGYSLFDIEDVGTLCVKGASRWARAGQVRLSEGDMESLVAFLVESVWRMSERYDRGRSTSFKAIVIGRIPNRCVDWLRQDRGRTRWQFGSHVYERERPDSVSLDILSADQMGSALGSVDGDPAAGGDPDSFGGLLNDRDSEEAWDTALVRALAHRVLRERGAGARAA